jgi:hypothetical protein
MHYLAKSSASTSGRPDNSGAREHFDRHDSIMHTLKGIGFALLFACGVVGYGVAGAAGVTRAALIFVPLWAIGAGINMYLGIKRAGYSFADEAPIFLLVFAVPAAVALGAWLEYR